MGQSYLLHWVHLGRVTCRYSALLQPSHLLREKQKLRVLQVSGALCLEKQVAEAAGPGPSSLGQEGGAGPPGFHRLAGRRGSTEQICRLLAGSQGGLAFRENHLLQSQNSVLPSWCCYLLSLLRSFASAAPNVVSATAFDLLTSFSDKKRKSVQEPQGIPEGPSGQEGRHCCGSVD